MAQQALSILVPASGAVTQTVTTRFVTTWAWVTNLSGGTVTVGYSSASVVTWPVGASFATPLQQSGAPGHDVTISVTGATAGSIIVVVLSDSQIQVSPGNVGPVVITGPVTISGPVTIDNAVNNAANIQTGQGSFDTQSDFAITLAATSATLLPAGGYIKTLRLVTTTGANAGTASYYFNGTLIYKVDVAANSQDVQDITFSVIGVSLPGTGITALNNGVSGMSVSGYGVFADPNVAPSRTGAIV